MSEKNIEKFKELLIFIIKEFEKGDLYETKLWKLMYFCDADFFEKNQKTITGIDYYKNKYGPTPDKKVINEALKRAKGFISKMSKEGNKTLYKPTNREYDFKYLSVNETESARDICEKYYLLNTKDIIVLSHEDPPFLLADKKKKIDFKFVFYRDPDILNEDEDKEIPRIKISDEAIKKLLEYV